MICTRLREVFSLAWISFILKVVQVFVGIFSLNSFKFILKAFPFHQILVPVFKFFQIVHNLLFYNLPISLFPASYTFQQAKLLKAGKVVLYTILCNVRKAFAYLLSGRFWMFF